MNLQLSKDRQKEVHYPSMSSSIWEVSKKKIQKKLCTKLDKYIDKPIIEIIRVFVHEDLNTVDPRQPINSTRLIVILVYVDFNNDHNS